MNIYKYYLFIKAYYIRKIMNININKVCSDGKVINPISGRCINKEALDKKMKKKEKIEQNNILQNNKKIIDNLKILADYERINNEPFKVKAYEKVIASIELYDKKKRCRKKDRRQDN